MADGIAEWFGGVLDLLMTNILCMVGLIIFGILLVIVIMVWYIRRILGEEIFVHGGKKFT